MQAKHQQHAVMTLVVMAHYMNNLVTRQALAALFTHLGREGVGKSEEVGIITALLPECQLALKKLQHAQAQK